MPLFSTTRADYERAGVLPVMADTSGDARTMPDCVRADVCQLHLRASILLHVLRPQFVHGVLDTPTGWIGS